jgi:hypothetical protein
MNANEAKNKANAISHKYPDTTRKAWEARKAFAKECGIDIKVFNKGLGPQYERLVGVLRGVKEIDAYVPVDERSIKTLRAEQKKLDQIITSYRAITTPKQKPVKHEPQWYGWYVLDSGLRSLQSWAKDGIRKVDADLQAREREQRAKR